MQTWQLSEEKGKLKVRAKTREVEATVLTVFLCFSCVFWAESMQFILVHWKNHTLHEADRPHGYELDDTNTTIDYTSIQYLIVLHTTFLSHSSKHAPDAACSLFSSPYCMHCVNSLWQVDLPFWQAAEAAAVAVAVAEDPMAAGSPHQISLHKEWLLGGPKLEMMGI